MTGKEKCEYFKKIREEIAKANDIPGFEYKDCNFQGDCDGTCPACDEELKALTDALSQKENAILNDKDFPLDPFGTVETMGIIEYDDSLINDVNEPDILKMSEIPSNSSENVQPEKKINKFPTDILRGKVKSDKSRKVRMLGDMKVTTPKNPLIDDDSEYRPRGIKNDD